ncbi:phosphoribosylglycinamide formyltransferase [uncultured Ferrovibrio sp.]|jgi:phosphoribosylglycinamide formyltransferase-1|uniref:phosphoribosylglycinamide formyltransferase n=1 Tax=uncultured Ferrovibrio sp. TaxID=1576913 RepID=UPI003423DBAD
MMDRKAVAVLISGRGSNLRALVEAADQLDFPARIALVLSNNPTAEGLDYAQAKGITTAVIPSKGRTREDFDAEVNETLRTHGIELVCLAGFMRILTEGFVQTWTGRMINIHPSLLPAFKGVKVHEQVVASGVRFTGCSVHFVTPGMDEGPIIIQAVVPVPIDATPETVAAAVLEQEHRIYPTALRWLAEGRLSIEGQVVRVKDATAASGVMISPSV